MGKRTLRHAIANDFPEESYEGILSILTSWGRGPGHARSCRDYFVLLKAASGDRQLLRKLVDSVCVQPEEVALYQRWQDAQAHYGTLWEHVRYFGPHVRRISLLLVPQLADCATSLSTLTLSPNFALHGPTTFVRPLADGRILVSREPLWSFEDKPGEDRLPLEGTFAACEDVSSVVLDYYKRGLSQGGSTRP